MLEYVDFDAFERREQELGRHRRTNEDAAVQRTISQIEGKLADETDTDNLTAFQQEVIRSDGATD